MAQLLPVSGDSANSIQQLREHGECPFPARWLTCFEEEYFEQENLHCYLFEMRMIAGSADVEIMINYLRAYEHINVEQLRTMVREDFPHRKIISMGIYTNMQLRPSDPYNVCFDTRAYHDGDVAVMVQIICQLVRQNPSFLDRSRNRFCLPHCNNNLLFEMLRQEFAPDISELGDVQEQEFPPMAISTLAMLRFTLLVGTLSGMY